MSLRASRALAVAVRPILCAAPAPPPPTPATPAPAQREVIGGRYRVWNENLPAHKQVAIAFMSLYGIGKSQSYRLCGDLGLNPHTKLSDISDEDFEPIKAKIESTFKPRHEAIKRMGDNILAKVRMGSYQGLRHQMCLPVHGQRTKCNAKTQRKLGLKRAQLFNIPIIAKKNRKAAIQGQSRV